MNILNKCFNHQTLLFMSRIRHWHDEVGCDNRNLIYNNRQLRSELKLEQKFNLRDAVYCLPQRYNDINSFCNFSNVDRLSTIHLFFSIFRQLLCAIGGAGMESCLLFDVWRMKKILDVCKFGHISLLCFWKKFNLNFKTSVFIWLAIFWRLF